MSRRGQPPPPRRPAPPSTVCACTCGSVGELTLFCDKCLKPLRASQALSKDQEAAVFSSWLKVPFF